MEKLDSLINHLNPLDLQEKGDIRGGYVALELSIERTFGDGDTNYFQCSCNNYQCHCNKIKTKSNH